MGKLFEINSKNIPSIYDSNTIYSVSKECPKCKRQKTSIDVLGAYLPTFKHAFGLISPLGGIIGSKKAIEHLINNDIKGFSIENAVVTYGKRNDKEEEYYWIKPLHEIELDSEKGPGTVIMCNECNLGIWNDKEGLNIVKKPFSSDLLIIKNTWKILCTERFMDIAKKTPDKCYLDFEEWNYSIKID